MDDPDGLGRPATSPDQRRYPGLVTFVASARMRIRPGRPDDSDAVASVCRATADGGQPQPQDHADPDLVALVYARPYLALEPGTARLILDEDDVVGYVVGAADSSSFYRRWAHEWTPHHLPRPAVTDADLAELLQDPMSALPGGVETYPSHLHINLLPQARGSGAGRDLLESFVDGLSAAGSPGVHVRVGIDNAAALRFYERAGFAPVGVTAGTTTLGRGLG